MNLSFQKMKVIISNVKKFKVKRWIQYKMSIQNRVDCKIVNSFENVGFNIKIKV